MYRWRRVLQWHWAGVNDYGDHAIVWMCNCGWHKDQPVNCWELNTVRQVIEEKCGYRQGGRVRLDGKREIGCRFLTPLSPSSPPRCLSIFFAQSFLPLFPFRFPLVAFDILMRMAVVGPFRKLKEVTEHNPAMSLCRHKSCCDQHRYTTTEYPLNEKDLGDSCRMDDT